MSSFPNHKPVCWELFRNEPLESQNRRAAIAKSWTSAQKDTKKNPLWWDSQKYVDQVVPAEFIAPSDIDTATFRYQVFARPPPIECPPRSLREVTDAAPPIRYNVKRVAVDKPFPAPSFECAGHWAKHQFVLQRGAGQDSSRNNNTGPARQRGPAVSQDRAIIYPDKNRSARNETLSGHKSMNTLGLGRPQEPKGMVSSQIGTQSDMERRCERKTKISLDENNSQVCPSLALMPDCYHQSKSQEPAIPSHSDAAQSNLPCHSEIMPNDQKHDHLVQGRLHMPQMSSRPTLSARCDKSVLNTERSYPYHTLSQDGNSHSERTCYTPKRSCHTSHSYISNYSTGSARPGNRCENLCFQSTSNLPGCEVNLIASRISRQPSPKDLMRPHVRHAASAYSSRAGSPCSVSTVASCLSTKRPSATNCARLDQGGPVKSEYNLRRESVASLLSETRASSALTSSVGRGRKKFLTPKMSISQESVASLLSVSNHNNNSPYEVSVFLLPSGALQDLFAEFIYPSLPQGELYSNITEHRSVPNKLHKGLYNFGENACSSMTSANEDMFLMPRTAEGETYPLCTNNNASEVSNTKSERYTLRCCPVKTCKAEKERMICRFHLKRPEIPEHQPFVLDQVIPIDPADWKVKHNGDPKEFQCTVLTNCRTGKPIESTEGPLMVCEPRQQMTPDIGYGTYKIVGGLQRREAPFPNYLTNLKLPPEIEEYKEFTRRCPNFKRGRYDRTDPLNEMLLPSNKPTTLLGGSQLGPYSFCKMPRRKLPALFKPPKKSNDLTWSLPTSRVN